MQIDKEALEIWNRGKKSQSEIGEELSAKYGIDLTRDKVRHAIDRARTNMVSLKDKPVSVPTPYYDKYKKTIEDSLHARKNPVPSNAEDILILQDLHVPFQYDDKLEFAVERNLTADLTIINGDIMDCYALSVFRKDYSVPFEVELDGIMRVAEYLSQNLNHIVMLACNHDNRPKRLLQKVVPPSLFFLLEANILEKLMSPFPNITIVDNWYWQYGDLIVAHPEANSKVELKTPINAYKWFREWKDDIDIGDFKALCVAHTHQMGVSYKSTNCKVIEGGCLCQSMNYAKQSIRYPSPQTNGYVTLKQENGKTIWNTFRERLFL